MHILFVHKNFPAQFGHIATRLVRQHGFRCTFLSERPAGTANGVTRLQYTIRGAATAKTHFCSRTFENYTWHSHGVYQAMEAVPEIVPDLVVGHSGFGSTLFLADLYECPIINYFEWYYRHVASDGDFRAELPRHPLSPLRSRIRNAMLLADLQTCTLGYCPTEWQRSQMPAEYQGKLETIFDGIDTEVWRPGQEARTGNREIAGRVIPRGTRVVTYVSRGFESLRGFDIFMQIAKRICDTRDDVLFVCVGTDGVFYGDDNNRVPEGTFREHVLAQDDYDLQRFVFTGRVSPSELARILRISDLHVYLTVPFVLSWSLMNALACGCVVLASDTAPVQEVISHGVNGLLAPFYDIAGFVRQALEVLDDPRAYECLGTAAAEMIATHYSVDAVVPRMLKLYEKALTRGGGQGESRRLELHDQSKDAGGKDPWRGCRKPWPHEQPFRTRVQDNDVLRPERRFAAFRRVLAPDTERVLHLGASDGQLTSAIARLAPRARIVAVERWRNGAECRHNGTMDLARFEDFCTNCWDQKQRITPLGTSWNSAVKILQQVAFEPQVVVCHCSHEPNLEADIARIREQFPEIDLVGDNWHWPRVQRMIERLVEMDYVGVEVAGDAWRIWSDAPLRARCSSSSGSVGADGYVPGAGADSGRR